MVGCGMLRACEIFMYVFFVLSIVFVGLAAADVYKTQQSETIEIRKNEWSCTKSKTKTIYTPIIVGTVPVTVPTTVSVCTEYKRIDE